MARDLLYGAIIGDIAGSRFEFNNNKSKKGYGLLEEGCFFTDDSVMTCAIADAIMHSRPDFSDLKDQAVVSMRLFGRMYPHAGYGKRFIRWLESRHPEPYGSLGNGSAMRVSPVAYAASSLDETIALSRAVTEVTHNHPEGIKGAEATAVCVYLARKGYDKDDIGSYVREHYYPLNFTLDEIREEYKFNELAQFTVPQAIEAFLESTSFEDAIRNAISIGGDSDTLACITGSIAGAYYEIPTAHRWAAGLILERALRNVASEFELYIARREGNA